MPAVDIVAHRIVWSVPFLALLLSVARGWARSGRRSRNRRTLGMLLVTALLIGGNWLLYVYAVNSGHILAEASAITSTRSPTSCSAGSSSRSGCPGCNGPRSPSPRPVSRACCRRARPAVDQPHPVRQLRDLRPASEDRAGRCASPGLAIETGMLASRRSGLAGLEYPRGRSRSSAGLTSMSLLIASRAW